MHGMSICFRSGQTESLVTQLWVAERRLELIRQRGYHVNDSLIFKGANVDSRRLKLLALNISILSCLQVAAPILLVAQTATIHVRVVDGRTGHSISGMNLAFVDYHTDQKGGQQDDLNGRKSITASADGDSYISNPDAHGVLVFNGMGRNGFWTPCSKQRFYDSNTRTYGNDYLYPVSTIVNSGFVAKNNCSKVSAAAKSGELVIFIRPTTWWERFVSGMKS
jgi:hypothetical protein